MISTQKSAAGVRFLLPRRQILLLSLLYSSSPATREAVAFGSCNPSFGKVLALTAGTGGAFASTNNNMSRFSPYPTPSSSPRGHSSNFSAMASSSALRSSPTEIPDIRNGGTASTSPLSSRPPSWNTLSAQAIERCILPLSFSSHKGSSGRVAVLGGSAQYTGAPYYAAMAALKAGCDLAYVLTAEEAALPIKCYSPELMVTSVYSAKEFERAAAAADDGDDSNTEALIQTMVDKVLSMVDRLHCLIVGPGLGRDPMLLEAVARILDKLPSSLYVVLDADALFLLSQHPNVLAGRKQQDNNNKVVLTPNAVEYQRLLDSKPVVLQTATIVQKGRYDQIYVGQVGSIIGNNPVPMVVCGESGGRKRSGGIGDVLAGTMGTLLAWQSILHETRCSSFNNSKTSLSEATAVTQSNTSDDPKKQKMTLSHDADEGDDDDDNYEQVEELALACWSACCFVKRATKRAFDSKKRAMTAPDVLDQLGPAIDEMTQDSDLYSSMRLVY